MKFSVVIPCYHSEDFIGKAISSIKCQSFTDYEVLVMCESNDSLSIKAVEECGITPIIDDYGSSGSARNAGIDKAKGDYILFLDSDDYFLHSECFAILNQFTKFPLDVLTEGFIFGIYGYTGPTGNRGCMYPNVWSRVWRKHFLDANNIRFPEISRDEDVVFVDKAFKANPAHRITDIPFVYYNYPREGSRMSEKEQEENGNNIIK